MSERLVYFDLPRDGTASTSDTTDIGLRTNEEAVRESVMNIISTEPNTLIYGRRELGCPLEQYLFELIDIKTAVNILEDVTLAITKFETRAKNLFVEVIPMEDENTFEINISFSVDQSDREIVIQELLYRLR